MKTAYQQLEESYRDDVLTGGDTRFNRLLQLAESERRERVASSLVDFLEQGRQLMAAGAALLKPQIFNPPKR